MITTAIIATVGFVFLLLPGFACDWYYYFSGRHSSLRSDFETYIEFMVEAGESLVIYRGQVENYRLRDSDSEYVRLINVARTGIIQW